MISFNVFSCARPGLTFGVTIFGFPLAIELRYDKNWNTWDLRVFLFFIKIVITWERMK